MSPRKNLILKGGVLLAAYDLRRPTRDIDLLAQNVGNDVASVVDIMSEILGISNDDGCMYGAETGESIREDSHRRVFVHPSRGFLQPRHVDDMVDGVKDALGVLPRQLCYPFDVCVDAPPGPAGDGSPTSQLLRAALTSVVPFRRTSFPSIGGTSSFAQFFVLVQVGDQPLPGGCFPARSLSVVSVVHRS